MSHAEEVLFVRHRGRVPAQTFYGFRRGFSPTFFCATCLVLETTQHILLDCIRYSSICMHLVQLFGSANVSFRMLNILSLGAARATRPIPVICRAAFEFLKNTRRFS